MIREKSSGVFFIQKQKGATMKREYVKETSGDKVVYRMLSCFGSNKPGREVTAVEWDLDSYISYCMFPIGHFIKMMKAASDGEDVISEYADTLDRLYDAAQAQLGKMEDAIYENAGWIKITTTNEDCFGGFLQQDFLEVVVEKEKNKIEAVG